MSGLAWNKNLNVILTLLLLGLIFTGVVLEFVLPPAVRRLDRPEEGRRRRWSVRVEIPAAEPPTFLTLERHQWGTIHFYISIVFVAGIILHLYLHWAWIRRVYLSRQRRSQK